MKNEIVVRAGARASALISGLVPRCTIGGAAVGCAVLGCVLLASSCETVKEKLAQKATEAAIEHASGGEVKIDSNNHTVTVKSEKGNVQFSGAGSKIPDDWPKDIPVYPGAQVKMSMSNSEQQLLALETTDSPDQAVAFYKSKLSAMKQEGTMSTEQQTMLGYKDDNGRHVQLSIGKDQGGGSGTSIAVIVNPPKKPAGGAQ